MFRPAWFQPRRKRWIGTNVATAHSAKATFVVLSGLTGADGKITGSRVFSSDQPVSGRIRKSSSAPFYKTKNISGMVDNATGLTTVMQLVLDQ